MLTQCKGEWQKSVYGLTCKSCAVFLGSLFQLFLSVWSCLILSPASTIITFPNFMKRHSLPDRNPPERHVSRLNTSSPQRHVNLIISCSVLVVKYFRAACQDLGLCGLVDPRPAFVGPCCHLLSLLGHRLQLPPFLLPCWHCFPWPARELPRLVQ